MPVCDILDLPAAELALWYDWYSLYGFPADRAEWGRAIVGEYVGAVWGGKLRAEKLLPNISRATELDDIPGVRAWFDRVGKR